MKFLQKHKAYILGLYAFLIFVHFVLKDYFFPLSIVFYASPLPLIILFGFLPLVLYIKKKWLFALFLIIKFGLIYLWLSNHFSISIPLNKGQSSYQLLFWNVAKKKDLQIDIISNEIKSNNASIIALVETKFLKPSEVELLKSKFPAYNFKALKDEMLIGVRGEIDSIYNKYIEDSYKFNYIEASIDKQKIRILITDLSASPFINKEKPLQAILNFSEEHKIDMIIGDFNTPYESVHFKPYLKSYNTFRNYGNGFAETWPHNFPLLELDQIWLNKKHRPISLKKKYYSKSDHKLLIAKYRLK